MIWTSFYVKVLDRDPRPNKVRKGEEVVNNITYVN